MELVVRMEKKKNKKGSFFEWYYNIFLKFNIGNIF